MKSSHKTNFNYLVLLLFGLFLILVLLQQQQIVNYASRYAKNRAPRKVQNLTPPPSHAKKALEGTLPIAEQLRNVQ